MIPTATFTASAWGASSPLTSEARILEPISTFCFLAAKTTTPRLGLSTLVVPYRNPVLTAKMLSTLDVLSGGRVILGVGTGWMREEFEILGFPSLRRQGKGHRRVPDIFIELWTSDDPSYQEKHYQVSNVGFLPKPVQKPHPPIWVGGHTRPAFRRIARYG